MHNAAPMRILPYRAPWRLGLLALVTACLPVGIRAQSLSLPQGWEQGHWRAVVSPYAPHWRPSDEHRYVWAVGVERQRPDHWLAGASFFSNSFGQPSAYVYGGRRFDALFGVPELYGQVSAGLMYGYRGKYQHKVPMNVNGFSPGALASLGWQFDREWSLTVHAVGDAAVMFQVGRDLR